MNKQLNPNGCLKINKSSSVKELFKKRLFFSKSKINLPLITNSTMHYFRNNSNRSNIQKLFLSKDENLVKKLNLDSKETPFELINEKSDILKILDEKREKYIVEIKNSKENNIKENYFLDKKKRQYIKKSSMVQKEKEIKDELLALKQKIEKLKEEKENYKNQITRLINKIDENEIFLDVIKSYNNSNTNILNDFNNGRRISTSKLKKTPSLSFIKADFKRKKNNLISNLQREFELNQKRKNKFINDILSNKENIKNLKEKIIEIKEELNDLKLKFNHDKKKLLNHYHYLFFEGIDTREEGLIWIILSIWDLDEDVNMDFIPNFLDEKAIEFLFIMANKKNSLLKVEKNIEKFLLKNKMIKDTVNNNKNCNNNINNNNLNFEVFKTIPLNTKENIINVKGFNLRNVKNNINNNYTMKDIIQIMEKEKKSQNRNKEFEENFVVFDQLKRLKECILKEIDMLKKNEIIRITKEFLENDYERRFKVTFNVVLSALVGEYNMLKEREKQKLFKNEYLKKIKKCNFYHLFKNKFNFYQKETLKNLNNKKIYE